MAELFPIPLDLQLRRAFAEYEREDKIFDLPRAKFFRGLPGLDLSVVCNGHRAFTPLGPAAGPHTQLLQNIVLGWLAGARIFELKTVQILDELQIPRPCIDAENVTYNVEWSQELKLEQSLREYASASMFLAILRESKLLGDDLPPGFYDTVLDMSVGYNLEGIRSPRMRGWIQGMKHAAAVIDELRPTLTGRFRRFRDLPFAETISDSTTLSTFHGCPAGELEGIVSFLLRDMGVNVCVKMNPTLLGRDEVAHLLHDVLGYGDILLDDSAFEHDLQMDEAVDLVTRLQSVAHSCGRQLSLKFSNTLVVRNHRRVFSDERMYLSGPPLHVLTLNLVRRFRERISDVPLSFSAGLTANNVADTAAMNFIPLTTCSDLLREGGYGRLPRYLDNLGAAMRAQGAGAINEYIVRAAGQGAAAIERTAASLRESLRAIANGADGPWRRAAETWITFALEPGLRAWLEKQERPLSEICAELTRKIRQMAQVNNDGLTMRFAAELAYLEQTLVSHAGLLNTPLLVERATADPRYRRERNQAAPRKIGSALSLFDCIACDKCLPVCPNAANFVYETAPLEIAYQNYELQPDGGFHAVPGGTFRVTKRRQIANYPDACNDCGNCNVFCPEDGGPQRQKPRFFRGLDAYSRHAGGSGFFIEFDRGTKAIYGTLAGRQYKLTTDSEAADCVRFEDEGGEYIIRPSRHALVSWRAKDPAATRLDLLPYLQLKLLLDAVGDTRRVNYANVPALES